MHLEYEISEQDFLDAQRLAIKNSPVRSIRWSRIGIPLFGLLLFMFWLQSTYTHGLSLRSAIGVVFPILFMSIPLLTKWNARKMYARTTSFRCVQRLDVDEEAMSVSGETFSGKIGWSNYRQFFEDERCFVLYQDSTVFNIIPKRQLSSEQISWLRQHFNRKIEDSKP